MRTSHPFNSILLALAAALLSSIAYIYFLPNHTLPNSTSKMLNQLQVLAVTVSSDLTPKALEKLEKAFKTIHRVQDPEKVSEEVMRETEIWFTGGGGLPKVIKGVEDIPKTKVVQLASGECGPDRF
jgi:hypothetical protein